MAFMFDDFSATVRHGSDLPSCGGGTTGHGDRASLPDDRIVSPGLHVSTTFVAPAYDNTLHDQTDSSAPSSPRDSQQVAASSADNNRTNGVRIGVSELVHSAIVDTDFVHDLTDDQHLLLSCVENAIDMAADMWSDAHGFEPVPLDTIILARAALLAEAQDMLVDRAEAAADAIRDSQEAGDLDPDGGWVPYPRYFGV
jgi:hypothetical protein